jgi:hypothetical protein
MRHKLSHRLSANNKTTLTARPAIDWPSSPHSFAARKAAESATESRNAV